MQMHMQTLFLHFPFREEKKKIPNLQGVGWASRKSSCLAFEFCVCVCVWFFF